MRIKLIDSPLSRLVRFHSNEWAKFTQRKLPLKLSFKAHSGFHRHTVVSRAESVYGNRKYHYWEYYERFEYHGNIFIIACKRDCIVDDKKREKLQSKTRNYFWEFCFHLFCLGSNNFNHMLNKEIHRRELRRADIACVSLLSFLSQ